MHSGGVLGGQAETLEKYVNQRLASKSYKIEGIYVKLCILEGSGRPGRNLEKLAKSLISFKIT